MIRCAAIVTLAMLASVTAVAAEPAMPGARFTWDLWCAPCHAAGPGHPGTAALAVKYGGKLPAELERRTDLQPALVKLSVRTGVSVMPFFRKTEISDAELDALAAWLSPQAAKKRLRAAR